MDSRHGAGHGRPVKGNGSGRRRSVKGVESTRGPRRAVGLTSGWNSVLCWRLRMDRSCFRSYPCHLIASSVRKLNLGNLKSGTPGRI